MGVGTGVLLARLHGGRSSVFWKQPNDFCCRLAPTFGKQALLDDDALDGVWDGVVEERRKGKGVEEEEE
jgi:hypothetical protein